MTYIWINPVTDRMYDKGRLEDFLRNHGYCRVECRENWGAVVREKYLQLKKEVSAVAGSTVADVRCPVVEHLIRGGDHPGLVVPEIEPILLHCGREISGREDLRGKKKIITTPCRALAEAGNRLNLEETEFLPWNLFLKRLGRVLPGKNLENSPIPPGFFGPPEEAEAVTGPKEVEDYLQEKKWKGGTIVEFLYCKEGCHRGDGVAQW